ncbi:hypothetical protein [Streptomyces sp. TRM75561]|uniref:hypothetical protein n=1 Tax=Streptomyces sp. TRM75561 TaxID=2975269 RepID=UPI0024499AE2|nr:hypothetical protein [Streptomyces sp. TRM75561]MDH3037898.1 hypothetical protein [Streptomyces sp. TRM75561]
MARITHIQTGAERAAGQPGQMHNETLQRIQQEMDQVAARTDARIAETHSRIEATRAELNQRRKR